MDSSPDPRHFVGRESYEQAVDELLPWAIHHICLFDQSLSARSDTARRIEALRARLRAGVKVRLLAHDGSRLERDCPRTLSLLKHFGHGLAIHRTPDEAAHLYGPFCHVDARGYARRYHFDDLRGSPAWRIWTPRRTWHVALTRCGACPPRHWPPQHWVYDPPFAPKIDCADRERQGWPRNHAPVIRNFLQTSRFDSRFC